MSNHSDKTTKGADGDLENQSVSTEAGNNQVANPVLAYCEACEKKIDITDMEFVGYADEQPMVLDIQLPENATEQHAIDFVKEHGTWNFSDWNDGEEVMWHYPNVNKLSHMEVSDDTHILQIKGGYWSPL